MMQRPQTREFVGRAGDFVRHYRFSSACAVAWVEIWFPDIKYDVMTLINPCAGDTQSVTERPRNHLGVQIAVKDGGVADDGPVHVAGVVEDGAASAATTDEVDLGRIIL